MTICIAAICTHNKKKAIVFSTDHMIDVGIGQFEHDIKKHKKINEKTIAMLAGQALLFDDLIKSIPKGSSFSQIKTKILDNFSKIKTDCIKRELLSKYNLNFDDVKNFIVNPIQNPFVGKILDQITKFSLNTSILLVGFEDSRAQISEIQEYGMADFNDIHFHAIGSGHVQAINTLMFQKQLIEDDLSTTIYNVYKAKRNAEVCTGVGRDTDLLILTEKKCIKLKEEDVEILSKIYSDESQIGKTSKSLNNLKVGKYI